MYICIIKINYMRRIVKNFISITLLSLIFSVNSFAQSKEFKAGQSLEIQYNILKELQQNYVDSIKFDKMVKEGIDAMLESLDPYTEYITEENDDQIELMTTATYGGIGALIKKVDSLGVVISQPYFGSPAVKYGLEPGDIILKINGEDVKPLSADKCSSKMKGQPGTEVVFLVKKARSGEIKEIKITRERVHISDVSYSGMYNNSIAYIKLDAFSVGGAEDVRKALLSLKEKGAKKLVLDLRGNGGGVMEEAIDIVSLFVNKGTTVVSSKGRSPEFLKTYKTTKEPVDTLIPLMVLVNSGSASASEIVAGAIQDLDRGVIMGTRSFGKGLIQGFQSVGYGGKLKFTIAKYYTPSGRCVQSLDYSNRNADGSVGNVPDSLKKAFKTLKGRTVYDGGGITPDTIINTLPYSRPAVSLVVNDIIGDYAIKYYAKHDSIGPIKDFKLSNEQYQDFVEYASKREFDSRSAAQVLVDQIIKASKTEDLYEIYKTEFDALEKKLCLDKKQMLIIKRNEIQPLLEEEIANKFYFTKGRVEAIIKNDKQLIKAMEIFAK